MENILLVVFDGEKEASEGLSALNQLDCDGIITIYAGAVIWKDANGTVSVKDAQGNFPSHTIAGVTLGGLIGLLGGPAGSGLGATIGGVTGIIRDLRASGTNRRFVEDVSAILKPGKFAVIADVSEDQIASIDTRMETLGGGMVFRMRKQNFECKLRAQEITQISDQINQLKHEEEMAMSDEKTDIQTQIDSLNQTLQEAKTQADQIIQKMKSDTEAKVQVLQQQAAKAQGDAKASINAQIDQLHKQYESSIAQLRNATAEKLKEVAVKIQKTA